MSLHNSENSYVTIAASQRSSNKFKACFEFERRSNGANAVFADSHWLAAETEMSEVCDDEGQAKKSARGMPWHQEPKKDVTSCDKLR